MPKFQNIIHEKIYNKIRIWETSYSHKILRYPRIYKEKNTQRQIIPTIALLETNKKYENRKYEHFTLSQWGEGSE